MLRTFQGADTCRASPRRIELAVQDLLILTLASMLGATIDRTKDFPEDSIVDNQLCKYLRCSSQRPNPCGHSAFERCSRGTLSRRLTS